MVSTGITVDEALRARWNQIREDTTIVCMQVKIQDENFSITNELLASGDATQDWDNVRASLDTKTASYNIFRNGKDGAWVNIFSVPHSCKVRERMLYASSVKTLKRALDDSYFTQDYHITDLADCNYPAYAKFTQDVNLLDIMTEKEFLNNEMSQNMPEAFSATKVSAIVELPLKLQEPAREAFQEILAKKVNTAVFSLDVTEELKLEKSGTFNLDDLSADLTDQEPRFILHSMTYTSHTTGKQVDANVLVYYCPMKAKPKRKMFYSASKKVVVSLCKAIGFELARPVETSDAADISFAYVDGMVNPKPVEEKAKFAKPTTGARRGKRRLHGGSKFSAN